MCAQQPVDGIVGAGRQPACNSRAVLTTVQQEQACDVDSHQAEGQWTKCRAEAKGFEQSRDLPEQPTLRLSFVHRKEQSLAGWRGIALRKEGN
jgi:hypothetical protein